MNNIPNNMQYQEDEIDLKELFLTIWNNKFKIVLITTVITLFAIFYAAKQANLYESRAVFSSSIGNVDEKASLLPEGLKGYLNLNVTSTVNAEISYSQLLSSYEFMRSFILKHKLYNVYDSKNQVFVLNLKFNSKKEFFGKINNGKLSPFQEDYIFNLYNKIKANFKIVKNKKNALITFSHKGDDRFFNQYIVDSFIVEASKKLYKNDYLNLSSKITRFKKEIMQTRELLLKNKLAELVTVLMQKRIFLKTDKFYGLKEISKAEISYIKNKKGPKRALIVVVAFITGFILSIFLVFVLEFFRKED